MLLVMALAAFPSMLLAQSRPDPVLNIADRYTFSTGIDQTLWSPTPTNYTTVLAPGSGNEVMATVSLNFLFYYVGTTYQYVVVTDDGSVCFYQPTLSANYMYNNVVLDSIHPLANHRQGCHKINGFGHNGYISTNSYVHSWIDSSETYQRLVIEFNLAELTDTSKQLKYQVQLEEHTNNITFVYAPSNNATSGSNYQIGLAYEYWPCETYSNIEANHIDVGNDTIEYVANNCSLYNQAGTWPAANRYYQFSYTSEPVFELPYIETCEEAFDWCDAMHLDNLDRLPDGWKYRTVGNIGEWARPGGLGFVGPQVYNYPSEDIRYDHGLFRLQIISDALCMMPKFNRKLSSLKLSFDYVGSGFVEPDGMYVAAAYSDTTIILDTIFWRTYNHEVLFLSQYDSILSMRDTSNVHIAFYLPSSGDGIGACYIDNIRVEIAPDCAPPAHLHVDAIDMHTSTLSWRTNGATEWHAAYDTIGAPFLSHTLTGITTNSITLDNLLAGKAYDFYLWADCAGTTDTVHIRFYTQTTPIETLPYYTSFEDGEDQAWNTHVNVRKNNEWLIDTAIAMSGERSLYISSSEGIHPDFEYAFDSVNIYNQLVGIGIPKWIYTTRAVHITSPGTYTLAYDWICQGGIYHGAYAGAFIVPASIDIIPDSSNGILEHVTVPNSGGHPIYTIEAPQGWVDMCDVGGPDAIVVLDSTMCWQLEWKTYEGTATITDTGIYNIVFVFKMENQGLNVFSCAFDNVWFGLNTCPAVEDLQITHLTYDSVVLSWASTGDETQWLVNVPGIVENELTTNTTYTVTGLSTVTDYTAYVQAFCSSTDTSRRAAIKFITPCEAQQLPYYENFDNIVALRRWTEKLPDCWDFSFRDLVDYYRDPYYIYPQVCVNTDGNGILSLHNHATVILPPMDAPMSALQLDFIVDTGLYNNRLIVGVMEGQRFVPYDTVSHNGSSLYEHKTFYMGDYIGTGNRLAFRNQYYSSTGNHYIKIDSIAVTWAPACVGPTNLQLTSRAHTSASMRWHANGAPAWIVEYGPAGFTPGTGTVDTVYTSSYTFSGLSPLTTYDCYVSAICGAADTATITFTTRNTPVATLPYYTGFEPGDDTNWEFRNGANGWYIGTATAYASDRSIYISANGGTSHGYTNTTSYSYALRDFLVTTPGDYTIAFDWHCQGQLGTNYMRVFLVPSSATIVSGTDNNIISQGTPEGWINVGVHNNYLQMAQQGDWTHFETTVTLDSSQLDTWTLAICFINGRFYLSEPPAAVDNVVFGIITCEQPTNITLDSASANSLSFSWSAGNAPQQWEIWVNGHLNGTSTGPYFTATNLQSSTNYNIAVRGVCGAGDTSFFARATLTTECGVHVLTVDNPLYEDFESPTPPPLCWTIINTSVDNPILHTTTKAYTGSRSLRFSSWEEDSYDDYDQYLISPELDCTDSIYLSFMAQRHSSGDDLRIGYSTTTPDISSMTWRPWLSFPSNNAWHLFRDTLPPDTKYIALHYYGDYYYYVYVDSLTISTDALNCFSPVITDTTVTYRNIDITWDLSDSTEIIFYEGNMFFDTVTSFVCTAGNYSFTGLTPATTYTIALRDICDSTHYSDWNIFFITTDDLECIAPVTVTASASFTSAHITWTAGGSEVAWQVHLGYDALIPVTMTSADLTNLSQGWTYSVAVRPMCGFDNEVEGPWSDTVDFTTDACEAPTEVTATAITSTTATITWTPSANSTGSYYINYGLEDFTTGSGIVVPVTGTSFMITDLEPLTTYDVYVESQCAGNALSVWTTVYQFTTEQEGISDTPETGSVKLYPNPSNSVVTIAVEGMEGDATVSIVDLNGREVLQTTMNESVMSLDVSGLSKGAYFLRLTGERMNTIRKLLVL